MVYPFHAVVNVLKFEKPIGVLKEPYMLSCLSSLQIQLPGNTKFIPNPSKFLAETVIIQWHIHIPIFRQISK